MNEINELRDDRKYVISEYSSKPLEEENAYSYKVEDNIKKVVVLKIVQEAPDVKSFYLGPNKNLGTNNLDTFIPGQYITLKVNIDNVWTTRAYSLSSSPREATNGGFCRITIKRVLNGTVSNYMLDEVKVGDELEIIAPAGNFVYNEIKDEKNIIAVAGGSGITPFMSLAKWIEENDKPCNLTVLYSVKNEEDIIFKNEINEFNKKSKRVKFVITLTREEKQGYLNGHITYEMLEPYVKEFNMVLMCGPKALYKTMNGILLMFNIPRKCVRYETFYSEYRAEEEKTFKLKVLNKDEVIDITCNSNETILASLESNGIKAPSMCRVGECGFCRSILVEGKVKMVGSMMPKDLSDNSYIHPCVTYPDGDVTIRLDV